MDTLQDIAHHVNGVLTDYGHPRCSVRDVRRSIGLGVHELLKGVAPPFARDADRLEDAVALFKKRYREKPIRRTRAFPHVRKVLSRDLAGVKKAIITNKPQDITRMILEELDLAQYFELVIGMNAGHAPKPDPSSTFFVMKKFGVSPKDTVYIGDSRIDAETSRNAGIDFAWVDYGYDEPCGHSPRFTFSSASEWKKLAVNR